MNNIAYIDLIEVQWMMPKNSCNQKSLNSVSAVFDLGFAFGSVMMSYTSFQVEDREALK